jgi:exonuclease VII small subunit
MKNMVKNIEGMSFDEAIDELENILSELQNSTDGSGKAVSNEEAEEKLARAEQLKDYCKKLLEKEREDIIRTAKENNIPLEEIGLDEDALDISFDDDDDEDDDDLDEEE